MTTKPVGGAGRLPMNEKVVSREEFNNGIADEAAQSRVDWSNPERRKEALRYIVKQVWDEARGPVGGAGELTGFDEWWAHTEFALGASPKEVAYLAWKAAKAPQGVPKFAHDHSNLEEFIHDLAEATVYSTDDAGRVIAEYWKIEAVEWAKELGPREAAAPKTAPAFKAVRLEDGGAMGTHVVVPDADALEAPSTQDAKLWQPACPHIAAPALGAERLREPSDEECRKVINSITGEWHNNLTNVEVYGLAAKYLRPFLRSLREALAAAPPAARPHGLVNELEREIIRLNKDVADWIHEFHMYRGAWLREIGGYIRRKSHEIDGFVLRTQDALKEAEERGRHASAERVRELIAKWRKQAANISELIPVSVEVQSMGKSCAEHADELERALPPSTGEKS